MITNAISYYLAQSVHRHKDKDLFIEPSTGEHLSFNDFAVALGGVHQFLQQQGVGRKDIVTLIAANSIDLAVMMYGVITYGAVAKPLNPQVTSQEIKNLLDHSGSRIIFADHRIDLPGYTGKYFDIDSYRETTARNRHFIPGLDCKDDPALLIYTSGTTSQPKGVLLSHRNIAHNVLTAVQFYRLDHEHTKICILPLFHMFGFISDFSTMVFCGGTTVVLDTFDITRLSSVEAAIHQYDVNSFSAVPLMFELCIRFGCNLAGKHMKFCISGAAPLRQKTADHFLQAYGFPILQAYGLTETTCFATISPPGAARNNSAGIPASLTIRIMRQEGAEAVSGEIGEVWLAGESVMANPYFKSSIGCFAFEGQQWFKSGDLGYRDADGYVYITGRKKNMVIRGGEKIYLEDVDACLAELDTVADNACIRFEDGGSEKIAAFVVAREGTRITELEIMQFVESRLGTMRTPDLVIFSVRIPRTSTNKVKIRELQELVHGAAAPSLPV